MTKEQEKLEKRLEKVVRMRLKLEEMKKLKTVHISRESIKQSIIKDSFMFIVLMSSFYFNHKFIDNNVFVNILLIIAFIGLDCRLFTYHKYYHKVSEEKIEKIAKILERKNVSK